MLENITIGIPTTWNEMISVDNWMNNKTYDHKYFTIPFFNIDMKKNNFLLSENPSKDKIIVDKDHLMNIIKSNTNYNPKERGSYKETFHKKNAIRLIDILELIEGSVDLTFNKYDSERVLAAHTTNTNQMLTTMTAYILNIYDIFDRVNIKKLKEALVSKQYFLPLNELDKEGLLKNINPVIKKEIGCLEMEDMAYSNFEHIVGYRNGSSLYIKKTEKKEYNNALNDYLELKFGDKNKIKTDFKSTSFKNKLSKSYMIKKYNLNIKIKTSKYIVYTNNETMSCVFNENTGYCKIIKEVVVNNTMKVKYYSRSGFLMAKYYIKENNKRKDFKKMNESNFKLSDIGDGISTIIYNNNRPVKHLIRFNNGSNRYCNYTKSTLNMFKKYNSSTSKLIKCEYEKEILKIMKIKKFTVSMMRKLLEEYDIGEKGKLSQETIDLLIMKYSV